MPQSAAESFKLIPDAPDEIVDRNPTHIWIEPTNRCNTRCVHCGHFYENFGEDMKQDLYQKIREEALDGVERAELIGYGEPFMAKHFWEMFDECTKRGIEIYTTSNGILLRDDERVSRVVRNRVVLCLSLDGARKETFESVRPYIKWHKMIETLDCIKRNAEAAGDECKFRLRFNYVAMKRNIADLPDLVRLAHQYGASEIFVLPLGGEEVFKEVAGESLHASPELLSPYFMESLVLADKFRIDLHVPESFRPLILEGAERRRGVAGRIRFYQRRAQLAGLYLKRRGFSAVMSRLTRDDNPRAKAGVTYCNMPWKDAYFASDGTVFPCCIMQEKLGNMKEESWADIWNGQAYRNLRRTIHSWNPSAVCRGCSLPMGINGGDERQYKKFFSKFKSTGLAVDSPDLEFLDGFHELEKHSDGSASHRWMTRQGRLTVRIPSAAKFLRILLIPRVPMPQANPGRCQISGGAVEPFDNTCLDINFPIDHVRAGDNAEVLLEMENVHNAPNDPRDLALAIRGFEILS